MVLPLLLVVLLTLTTTDATTTTTATSTDCYIIHFREFFNQKLLNFLLSLYFSALMEFCSSVNI